VSGIAHEALPGDCSLAGRCLTPARRYLTRAGRGRRQAPPRPRPRSRPWTRSSRGRGDARHLRQRCLASPTRRWPEAAPSPGGIWRRPGVAW